MVEMDQNGVIRRVIELEETEEDIAYEVRRLAERIHRALNPELFLMSQLTRPRCRLIHCPTLNRPSVT